MIRKTSKQAILLGFLSHLIPIALAEPAEPFIGYIYPNSRDFFGIQRSTYNLNDIANISWTSGYSSQTLTLQCNDGFQGTGPPWQQIWGINSTNASGGGSVLLYVSTVNPLPAAQNTCRFVLDVREADANTDVVSGDAAAYSPDLSIDVGSGDEKGTTYLGYNAVVTKAAAASMVSSAISTTARSTLSAAFATITSPSPSPTMGASTSARSPSGAGLPTSSTSPPPASSSLSSGAATRIGVGIGVGLAILALTFLVTFLLYRRHQRKAVYSMQLGSSSFSRKELDLTLPRAEMFDASHYREMEHPYREEGSSRGVGVRNLAPGRVFEFPDAR
jgi:hypothetical protein